MTEVISAWISVRTEMTRALRRRTNWEVLQPEGTNILTDLAGVRERARHPGYRSYTVPEAHGPELERRLARPLDGAMEPDELLNHLTEDERPRGGLYDQLHAVAHLSDADYRTLTERVSHRAELRGALQELSQERFQGLTDAHQSSEPVAPSRWEQELLLTDRFPDRAALDHGIWIEDILAQLTKADLVRLAHQFNMDWELTRLRGTPAEELRALLRNHIGDVPDELWEEWADLLGRRVQVAEQTARLR